MSSLPSVRTGLVADTTSGELVVVDLETGAAHLLTGEAASAFVACEAGSGLPSEAGLAALAEAGLLVQDPSRRRVLTAAVVGGALVTTLALPGIAAAASGSTGGGGGGGGGNTALYIDAGGAGSGAYVAGAPYTSPASLYATANTVDTNGVPSAPPQSTLQDVVYGNTFSITGSGLTPSSPYTVTLYLAEIYWTSAGQRVFTASVVGGSTVSGIDVFQQAGGANKLIAITLTGTSTAAGELEVDFTTQTDNAMVNALSFT